MDCRLVLHEQPGAEPVVLQAHRAVLAATSRPFRSMLLGYAWKEREAVELHLHECSPARVAELLRFVYGHPVELEPDTALPLYRLADMYEVLELADRCCDYLKELADDVGRCVAIVQHAEEVHCHTVVAHCLQVLTRNFEAVAAHESFVHLSHPLLTSILVDNDLAVRSESEVLNALLRWLDHDEERYERHLHDLAALIRWHKLPAIRIAWLEINRPALFAPGTPLAEYTREAYRHQALELATAKDEGLMALLATTRTRRRRRRLFDSSQLEFHVAVGTKGSEEGAFNCPEGVALSADGRIFVADSLNHRVQIFDSSGKFLAAFGSNGAAPGEFNMPGGVAVGMDGDGREILVVTDQGNGRLQIFTSEGTFVRVIGMPGSDDGQLLEPTGVFLVPGSGEIIVCDYQNCRVQVFGGDGRFLRLFGRPGDGDGEFKHPSGIALSADAKQLIVADYQNDRLQVFDWTNGAFVRTIGRHGSEPGEFERPFDVAVASDGHILTTDYENHRVQVLSPTGEYVSHFGSHGSGPSQFDSPGGIAVGADGDCVVVTDCGNGRFHIWRQRES